MDVNPFLQKMMKTDLARAERELKFVEAELDKLGVYDELGMDVAVPGAGAGAGVPSVVVRPGRQLQSTPSSSSLCGGAAGAAVEELGGSASSSSAGGGARDGRSSRSRLSLRSLLSDRHHHRRSKSALPDSGARGADAVRPLAVILEAEQQTVPRVVRGCCDFLRDGAGARLDVEGLFRISPNQEALRFLLGAFVESSAPCTLADCDLCRDDPHLVAAVLKRYLAEYVADALLGDEAAQCLAAIARRDGGLDAHVRDVRRVVERVVAPAQRTVLHYLVLFFRDVAAHAAHNLMDAANIGVVFGPALFHLHTAASAFDTVAQSALASNTIRVLIEHYHTVFRAARPRAHGHSHGLSASGRRSKGGRRSSTAAAAAPAPAPASDTKAPDSTAAAAAPESPCARASLSRSLRRSGRRNGGGSSSNAPAAASQAAQGEAPGAGLLRSSRRGSGVGAGADGGLSGSQRRLLSIVRRDGSSPAKSLQSSQRSCGGAGAGVAPDAGDAGDAGDAAHSARASSRRPSVGSDVSSLSARLAQCTLDE